MRSLVNFLRVAIFASCALWVLVRTPQVSPDGAPCPNYNTENCVEVKQTWVGKLPADEQSEALRSIADLLAKSGGSAL